MVGTAYFGEGMTMIEMQDGDPTEKGSYVAWVNPPEERFNVAQRIFLFWDGNRWSYPLSDQYYRDTVYGWAGPLQALLLD
jgi:hypothetical protein